LERKQQCRNTRRNIVEKCNRFSGNLKKLFSRNPEY